MNWFYRLLAGVTLLTSALSVGGPAQAAAISGLSSGSKLAPGLATQLANGYHRGCRWSNRWGRHRHRGNRIRFCDRRPGFTIGYYYGPNLYFGPPRAYYRGYRRGQRYYGRRRGRGFIDRRDFRPRARLRGNRVGRPRLRRDRPAGFLRPGDVRRFRGDRLRSPRVRGNRQFRQFRGGGQRSIRRRRSEAPATYVLTNFGGVTEVIGTLPLKI